MLNIPLSPRAILRALVDAVLGVIVPDLRLTWGRVHLMGHTIIDGQFSHPHGITVHVRELLPSGTWRDHVYTRSAIYGFDALPEEHVRANVVRRDAHAGSRCVTFEPSPVLRSLCRHCADNAAEHADRARRREAHEALKRAQVEVRAILAEVTGTPAGNLDITWSGSSVVRAYVYPTVLAERRGLTADERRQAEARGVVFLDDASAPHHDPELDEAPDSEEIPFP